MSVWLHDVAEYTIEPPTENNLLETSHVEINTNRQNPKSFCVWLNLFEKSVTEKKQKVNLVWTKGLALKFQGCNPKICWVN